MAVQNILNFVLVAVDSGDPVSQAGKTSRADTTHVAEPKYCYIDVFRCQQYPSAFQYDMRSRSGRFCCTGPAPRGRRVNLSSRRDMQTALKTVAEELQEKIKTRT